MVAPMRLPGLFLVVCMAAVLPPSAVGQEIEEMKLTVAEFAALDEHHQRQAMLSLNRRFLAAQRSHVSDGQQRTEEEAGLARMAANLIEFMYFIPWEGGDPVGFGNASTRIRRLALDEEGRARPVGPVFEELLSDAWNLLVLGKDPQILPRSDEEHLRFLQFNYQAELTRHASATARSATEAAQARLDAERRQLWEEMAAVSERLPDGRLVFIVGDDVRLLPSDPGGEIRLLAGSERAEVLRLLRNRR